MSDIKSLVRATVVVVDDVNVPVLDVLVVQRYCSNAMANDKSGCAPIYCDVNHALTWYLAFVRTFHLPSTATLDIS